MNEFDKLLEELSAIGTDSETLAKSFDGNDDDQDDANIAAAADDKGDGDLDDDGTKDGADGKPKEGEDGKVMAKSFELELENGEKVEAFDATELLKALGDRQEAQETALTKALSITLGTVKSQGELLKSQGELIKSLQTQVRELAGAGRGRKAVIAPNDKGSQGQEQLIKSQQQEGLTPVEFMAKALTAQEQGRITGLDVSRCESYLNRGMGIPEDIRVKVLGQ